MSETSAITNWHRMGESIGIYAATGWSVDDVRAYKADVTKEEAEEILLTYGNRIVDRMVEAGWIALEHAIYEFERGQE